MTSAVVDIETVGQPLTSFEERVRESLLASFDPSPSAGPLDAARRDEAEKRFSLWGATGRIIVIGMHNPESGQSRMIAGEDEKELLREFWSLVRAFDGQVTFNGKLFDFPFLLLRSAIQGVRPSVLLDCRRYTRRPHYDLREVLSNAYQEKRGSLDFFCSLFGIASPKGQMSGAGVGEAWRAGRLNEIVEYWRADVVATGELYLRVRDYF